MGEAEISDYTVKAVADARRLAKDQLFRKLYGMRRPRVYEDEEYPLGGVHLAMGDTLVTKQDDGTTLSYTKGGRYEDPLNDGGSIESTIANLVRRTEEWYEVQGSNVALAGARVR